MDLQGMQTPGVIGDLHFAVGAFTGFDRLLVLLPFNLRCAVIGRKIYQHFNTRGVIGSRRITFEFPGGGGVWEAMKDGTTKPWRR